MNPQLRFFTNAPVFRCVRRNIFTQFLMPFQSSLPPQAAATLQTHDFEQYCAFWPALFSSLDAFGAPLIAALIAVETLALPENAQLLEAARSHLPPGFEIPHTRPSLDQALHLWLITRNHPEVPWPLPTKPELETAPENPIVAAPAPPTDSSPISSTIQQSTHSLPKEDLSCTTLPKEDLSSVALAEEDPAESDAQADAVPLRRLKPWPEPISDGPALFDHIHDRALHYLFLPPGAAVVFTLWSGHAHAPKAFTHSPRLYLTSTEPGCGKTTALDFIACLCPDVLRTDNLRPAVLFRITHNHEPTLVLDEFDSYAHQYPELRGLINAGHNLHGCATRCEGPNVRFFKAYAATAIAGIGDLAPTLANRSIIIPLAKAPPGALPARFDRRHTKSEIALGRKMARWVQDNFAAITACDPVLPPEVINRLADNWRPLFAVAQVVGGHWPQRVIEAVKELTPKPQPVPLNGNGSIVQAVPAATVQLLTDIRQIFARSATDCLFSSTLVQSLRLVPNRPWSAANTAKGFTEARLAQQLFPLGILPRKITVQGRRAKGYKLADFKPAFALLPPAFIA